MAVKEFPVKKKEVMIFRDAVSESYWFAAAFGDIGDSGKYPFGCYDNCGPDSFEPYELMAPLAGNERFIGTQDDPADLWDRQRLIDEGFIHV